MLLHESDFLGLHFELRLLTSMASADPSWLAEGSAGRAALELELASPRIAIAKT
jgi:hypothetical protein